jgi:hypothetical protein
MKPKRKSKSKVKYIHKTNKTKHTQLNHTQMNHTQMKHTRKYKGGGFLSALTKIRSKEPATTSTSMFSDMTFKKFMYLSLVALSKVVASIAIMPIRNVDEIIPPDLCKTFANPFACSQSVLQYLFTGTKPDHHKVLPESDANDCISYDAESNKIVNCKQKGGTRSKKNKYNYNVPYQYEGQYGGDGMIIGCNDSNTNSGKGRGKGRPRNENDNKNKPIVNDNEYNNENDHEDENEADKKKKIIEDLNQHLNLLLDKLKKLNIYLRKYLCPKRKMTSLIYSINDVTLLEKTLKVCKTLLNKYEYDQYAKRDDRLKKCDSEYNKLKIGELKVQADTKHLGLLIFPKDLNCTDCNTGSLWAEVVGKYYSLFKGSIKGNRNNIYYIIMNIVQDMAKLDTNQNDEIINEIKNIVTNIECRSNLTQVIKYRIKELKELKDPGQIEETRKHNIEKCKDITDTTDRLIAIFNAEITNILLELNSGRKQGHWIWWVFPTTHIDKSDPLSTCVTKDTSNKFIDKINTKLWDECMYKVINILESDKKDSFNNDIERIKEFIKFWSDANNVKNHNKNYPFLRNMCGNLLQVDALKSK